ncbi:MAG: hypothetical protein U1A27_13480 [Phycisphaerae bacterium]
MEPDRIDIKGAREHNLRNVSLALPRNRLICLTGVSGSGKSSLAFDTLYAEGQRRYIESLSSYARQFLGQLQKPDVDQITGLSPAIAIQQKTSGWNPRSTVGTVTGVFDFLRVLYARIGLQHCTRCNRPIAAQSREQIITGILQLADPAAPRAAAPRSAPRATKDAPSGPDRVLILAPVARAQKGEFRDLFDDMLRAGYVRARVDGALVELTAPPELERNQRHDIEIVIDRLTLAPDVRPRLAESVEAALKLGAGTLIVAVASGEPAADVLFSARYACSACGLSFEPPTPQLFSFNSPGGMCPTCDGLGERMDFDLDLLIPNPGLSFLASCIVPLRGPPGKWRRHIYDGVAKHLGVKLDQPWSKLPERARHALLHGTGDAHITFEWKWSRGVWKHGDTFAGVLAELREKYRKANAAFVREYYEKFMRRVRCPDCAGDRLNAQARAVRIAAAPEPRQTSRRAAARPRPPRAATAIGPTLSELCRLPVDVARSLLDRLVLTPVQQVVVADVLKEVRARLDFLLDVGLHYLTLDRAAPSLSGGESQRIRLAGQIGSGLSGVLYVLDEPSIGLHPRDNRRLLESLVRLRDLGNTVVVVEHDEEAMRTADHVVDFGPGPGVRGGELVASGTLAEVMAEPRSVTGDYLAGRRQIEVPKKRRPVSRI